MRRCSVALYFPHLDRSGIAQFVASASRMVCRIWQAMRSSFTPTGAVIQIYGEHGFGKYGFWGWTFQHGSGLQF